MESCNLYALLRSNLERGSSHDFFRRDPGKVTTISRWQPNIIVLTVQASWTRNRLAEFRHPLQPLLLACFVERQFRS